MLEVDKQPSQRLVLDTISSSVRCMISRYGEFASVHILAALTYCHLDDDEDELWEFVYRGPYYIRMCMRMAMIVRLVRVP